MRAGADKSKVLLGNGAIYFNWGEETETLAGVTRGGGTFAVTREVRQIEHDGTYGNVKGMNRKTEVRPKLTFASVEIDPANLEKYFAGMHSAARTGYMELTESLAIADDEYLTNVAFVGETVAGAQVACILYNAIGNGNMELAFENKGEVATKVEYEGCYDNDDLTTVPYELRYYDAGDNAVTFTVTTGGSPVESATVYFNGSSKLTNDSGVAVFTNIAPETNKPYSVTKSGLATVYSSITVDGDESVAVTMS